MINCYIAPFTSSMAKNIPQSYWDAIIRFLIEKDCKIYIIKDKNQPDIPYTQPINNPDWDKMVEIYKNCHMFISLDTAFIHQVVYLMKHYNKLKMEDTPKGIVIYTQSSPFLFGYTNEKNIKNIFNERGMRLDQSGVWMGVPPNIHSVPPLDEIINVIDTTVKEIINKENK